MSYALRQDQGIAHELVEADLSVLPRLSLIEGCFGRVVEQIGRADGVVLLVPNDGRLQGIEGEKVGDVGGGRVLDDVCPDDALPRGLGQQPMAELLDVVLRCHIEFVQVAREEVVNLGKVLGVHLPQSGCLGLSRQGIFRDLPDFVAIGREGAESDFVELQPVDAAVEVSARADGLGQDDSGRVDGIPDLLDVATPSDLLDEHRGQPLGPQLLVHTEEIDFGGAEHVFAHSQLDGNTGNEGNQFPRRDDPNADMPLLFPARSHERPLEEGKRVVEPEHGFLVFDVVGVEEIVHLGHLQRKTEKKKFFLSARRRSEVGDRQNKTCVSSVKSMVTHSKPSSSAGPVTGTLGFTA